MAYSQSRLHNPLLRLPVGPRTPEHIPISLLPLTSTRAAHITRLYNLLLHLLSLPPSPRTTTQTVRAWRALAGCREVHLATLWRVGAAVIERSREGGAFDDEDDEEEERRERAARRAEWLKFCQEGREEKVDKFHEYVLALVASGRVEFALDELDAYLDNQPYHDSIALNTLYGLLALLTAQPSVTAAPPPPASSSSSSSDSDDERPSRRKASNGRSAKRAKTDADAASADEDYAVLLRSVALNSPQLLNKATERFKRAAQLDERQMREDERTASVPGEAARWLFMIRRFLDKSSSRETSPA
ncbi:hypothetical protein JCM6882_001297 [Rhodosporidiobolus microsporus]